MKERSRSVQDVALLLVIVVGIALATVTVYSQGSGQQPAQTPTQPPAQEVVVGRAQVAGAESPTPTPTPINWSTDPVLKRFVFRGIGPASMGGRVDDIVAVETNPYIVYIGFAIDKQWHDLSADLRYVLNRLDRRYSHRSFGSEHCLGGHRRSE